MSDINGGAKSPTQTHVTVTTDPGPNPQSLEIRLNIGYFKTPSGIVKLVELVSAVLIIPRWIAIALLGIIIVAPLPSSYISGAEYY